MCDGSHRLGPNQFVEFLPTPVDSSRSHRNLRSSIPTSSARLPRSSELRANESSPQIWALLYLAASSKTLCIPRSNVRDTVVPCPTSLATAASPPWRRTMLWTIASPRPLPPRAGQTARPAARTTNHAHRSGIQAAQLRGFHHALDRQNVRGDSHRHLAARVDVLHFDEAVLHHALQA